MTVKKYTVGMYQTNCYLVFDEKTKECAIIDCGDVEPKLDEYIESTSLSVKYIIFTHGHFDHIGGLSHYFDKYKPVVAIHPFDADCLTDEKANFTYPAPYNFIPVKPTALLRDGDKIKIGNLVFDVIHTPGHTKGGICLYTDGCLFSGDTLFYRSVGRTDFSGGSFKEIKESVLNLFRLPDNTRVYPGHGCGTTISEEKFENPFVRVD